MPVASTLRGVIVSFAILAGLTEPALAHQRQWLQVGQADYLLVVGSLDEPVFTGDKSGVDLTVLMPDPANPMDSRSEKAKPVEGLEKTLKVEVKAGPHARMFELEPRFRAPGRYDAVFYPTVATTYTYRVFGSIGGAPFDVTFTCNPAGHAPAAEDRSVVKSRRTSRARALPGASDAPRAKRGRVPPDALSLAPVGRRVVPEALRVRDLHLAFHLEVEVHLLRELGVEHERHGPILLTFPREVDADVILLARPLVE